MIDLYRFKSEMLDSLMGDKTARWLASEIECSEQTLSYIFNNKRYCTKSLAYIIVKTMHPDKEINDYFEYIEKGE